MLELEDEIELTQVTPDLLRSIAKLEPFGMANPEPVFLARGVRLLLPPKILKEKHAKLRVRQDTASQDSAAGNSKRSLQQNFDALAWRMAERIVEEKLLANDVVDLAFTLEENTHPEFGGIQLSVCDLKKLQMTSAAAALVS